MATRSVPQQKKLRSFKDNMEFSCLYIYIIQTIQYIVYWNIFISKFEFLMEISRQTCWRNVSRYY